MADLDDFFAKKDRKRTKSKKFTTPDDLAKKLEETIKKTEVKVRKEPQQSLQSTQPDDADHECIEQPKVEVLQEDEWKDFEEEGRKDYTGLKIGHLNLNDDDHHYSGTDGDGGDEGEGEDGDGERSAWKKVTSSNDPNANNVQESEEKVPAAPAPTTSGLYISPAMRNQQLQSVRIKKGVLPDIHNEEFFPTLGAAKIEELKKKKNEPAFEEVKHGSRFQRSSDLPTNAPVAIGNRYNSLADS